MLLLHLYITLLQLLSNFFLGNLPPASLLCQQLLLGFLGSFLAGDFLIHSHPQLLWEADNLLLECNGSWGEAQPRGQKSEPSQHCGEQVCPGHPRLCCGQLAQSRAHHSIVPLYQPVCLGVRPVNQHLLDAQAVAVVRKLTPKRPPQATPDG